MDNQTKDEKVLFYEREYYMFSNFSSFSVQYKDIIWMTSEHAYQAAKYTDEAIREKIRSARSSYDAFRIGREHSDAYRPDWSDIKVDVMREIVQAKLDQHPHIKEKLIETGEKEIIEDSPVDSFWGWGPNKDGQNKLGNIWMELRTEIKNESL